MPKLSDYELAVEMGRRLDTIELTEIEIARLQQTIADCRLDVVIMLVDNGHYDLFKVDMPKVRKFVAYQKGETRKGKRKTMDY